MRLADVKWDDVDSNFRTSKVKDDLRSYEIWDYTKQGGYSSGGMYRAWYNDLAEQWDQFETLLELACWLADKEPFFTTQT